jgi:hypothetical protein
MGLGFQTVFSTELSVDQIHRFALSGDREKLAIAGSRSPMAQNAAIGNLACVLTTIAKVRFRESLLVC